MQIIRATQAHLQAAAADLCESDLKEFHSMQAGRDPCDVLPKALDENVHAIVVNSRVLAVGGHTDIDIWFVTTNAVHSLSKAKRFEFYRCLKSHLGWVRQRSPGPKTNWVSVDNSAHIRLLTSLGASFERGIFKSPAGCAFKQFWL